MPIVTELVGTLDGDINVDIRARVAGFLIEQRYREGSFVKKGQWLFTIDPREYRAEVERARAAWMSARASWINARALRDRLRPLVEVDAVSRQDYDAAVANEKQQAAQVRATKAALDQAKLNLSYTRITSPIDGIAGRAEVQIGNLVGQGSPTLLTTVSKVDPVRVRFGLPERLWLELSRREGADGTVGPQRRIELFLADGSRHPYEGDLVFANRAVDPATGTIQVDAVFPNPDRILRPGQYARVRLQTRVLHGAVVVPERAIQALQNVTRVGVVDRGGVLHVREVELGPTVGGEVVIRRGVAAGEQVVVDGFAKAKDGQQVHPVPARPSAPPAGVGGSGAPRR
ncbi:MAG: efflux RND transporter periplasmic adaptor subunit [Myxococcaceae bacterium]|nr:efflux RND transporter periplasmic adaptor subunit [Myxococcaceae bacterium]